MKITIARGLTLKLGYGLISGCSITESNSDLRKLFEAAMQEVRTRFAGRDLSDDTTAQGIRALFHSVGIDPTRYRPSGEALARRALKGQELYYVNSIVDINNICSMQTLFPFGSYDANQIKGDVVLRLGKTGEMYKGISKDIDISGKLTTADDLGAFGSPIADSDRTKVSEATKRVLVVAYAPADSSDQEVEDAIGEYTELAKKFCGCAVEKKGIVNPS